MAVNPEEDMNRSMRIERDERHGVLLHIVWNGGGEVPQELKGHYTTTASAQAAIDVWAAKQEREIKVEPKLEAPVKDVK